MSAPRLREALAAAYRRQRVESPPLTRDAERAIGRRVATRWLLGATSVAVVGVLASMGWSAVLAASSESAQGDAAPSVEPQILPAVTYIPLDGGPEYAHRWGELKCGDPMLDPQPTAPDQRLSLDLSTSGLGVLATASLTWSAPETEPAPGRDPVLTVGAVEVVAVRDGVVVGMTIAQDMTHAWQQFGQNSTITGHSTLDTEQFYCVTYDEPTRSYLYHEVSLDPGAYQAFAVVRVFATPESVALFQVGKEAGVALIDERFRQGGVEYEVGSAACRALRAQKVLVRACLPDAIATARTDPEAGTVRVLYDAAALPQEFDVTLVSEPLEMVFE